MQTTGTALVALERCSLLRMWMSAEGSESAYRLLYLAAVRGDRREWAGERVPPEEFCQRGQRSL